MTNQPSAAVTSSQTAESTSPSKSDYGGIKRSRSRKKLGLNRGPRPVRKQEMTGRRKKAVLSPRKNKIKIPVSSTVASTTRASTVASCASDVPIVKVHVDGALTTPPHFLPGRGRSSKS